VSEDALLGARLNGGWNSFTALRHFSEF
jgi:hypothetical protein